MDTRNLELFPLDRTPAHSRLQPGDPWTFIFRSPLMAADRSRYVDVGDTIGYRPGGQLLVFKILAAHGMDAKASAYETVLIGPAAPDATMQAMPRPTAPADGAMAAA